MYYNSVSHKLMICEWIYVNVIYGAVRLLVDHLINTGPCLPFCVTSKRACFDQKESYVFKRLNGNKYRLKQNISLDKNIK